MSKKLQLWLVVVGASAACDGPPHQADQADAVPDTQPIDAAVPHCDPAKPFSILANDGLLTAGHEDAPWLTTDELTMYYGSAVQGGNWDILEATRAARDLPFSNPHPIAINTPVNERFPALTDDRLTLFAVRESNVPYPMSRILVSHRLSTVAAFAPLGYDPNLAAPSPPNYDSAVSVLPDRSAVWSANGESNWISHWSGTAYEPALPWAAPEGGVMTGDLLTVYMGKSTGGPASIVRATRSSPSEAFGMPMPVAELISSTSDYPRWVSRDGCTLTFTRYTTATNLDMYVAQKPL